LVTAKTMPASSISMAPTISILRLPIRSTVVVIHSEMAVSPSSVNVSNSPTRSSFKPMDFRYNTSTTDRNP